MHIKPDFFFQFIFFMTRAFSMLISQQNDIILKILYYLSLLYINTIIFFTFLEN